MSNKIKVYMEKDFDYEKNLQVLTQKGAVNRRRQECLFFQKKIYNSAKELVEKNGKRKELIKDLHEITKILIGYKKKLCELNESKHEYHKLFRKIS